MVLNHCIYLILNIHLMERTLSILTLFLFCFLLPQTSFAQLTFQWDAGVRVTLPDDFEVDKNIPGEFTASADGMEFHMLIFEEDLALEDMKDATLEIAEELAVAEIEEIRNIETPSGFEGKYVEGNADGQIIIIAGLIDPESTTNFFVVMSFFDDDDLAIEDAQKILNSLTK